MDPMEIPSDSFDPRRGQHHSTRILKELLVDLPGDALKIQGVVAEDLHIPILTYVFGEAQLGGVASVVSLARLDQAFHGLEPDFNLFLARLHKESLHELGHTFGLVHCHDPHCLMCLSNTILDVDRKGGSYCRRCFDAISNTLDHGR
jgi:archaemetzincin